LVVDLSLDVKGYNCNNFVHIILSIQLLLAIASKYIFITKLVGFPLEVRTFINNASEFKQEGRKPMIMAQNILMEPILEHEDGQNSLKK
jgi:hypothetical protein